MGIYQLKNRVLSWLQQQCIESLLAEKWLLCDSLRTAQMWKDRINLAGTATVNLHSKTLRSIVLAVVDDYLAVSKHVYLAQSASVSLMQELIDQGIESDSFRYFREVKRTEGLARLATRSIRDLRLAGIAPESLTGVGFEDRNKGVDLQLLYQRYTETLKERSLVDYADCLELAIQRLSDSGVNLPRELMVLQPLEIHWSLREQQFLDSLKAKVKCLRFGAATSEPESILGPHNTYFFSGYGEVNEVRGVVQRIVGNVNLDEEKNKVASAVRLDDVEIIYTCDSYVPLIYEFFEGCTFANDRLGWHRCDGPPVAFSEGIAAIYSRPGRALRAWLRWIDSDGLQSKAVQMVREGLLNRPAAEDQTTQIGYSRLAANLRRISIGFKVERYIPAIEKAIAHAELLQREFNLRREGDGLENEQGVEIKDDGIPRDFGLPVLNSLLSMLGPVVQLAPAASDSAAEVLRKAKRFLLECSRCESKVDRIARSALLDEIDGRLASLEYAEESSSAVTAWLEELPIQCAILASGPQPGCVYATPLIRAGHSGRKHVFVVGMDANRFPQSSRVDPLLLDTERRALSDNLETSTQCAIRHTKLLGDALQRIMETDAVRVSFSYSTRDLIEDRDRAPSASLVELFRKFKGLPDAHLNDLLQHIGDPVSFASTNASDWLSETDGPLTELLTTNDSTLCQTQLESRHSHFTSVRSAQEKRSLPQFTEYDGFVPEAGPELSPTNAERKVSPSRLETFGACPRRFFFRYGLEIYPPDEWSVDPERWLDPITLGSLVHGLFERFMRELTSKDQSPRLDRDLPRLLEMLEEAICEYQKEIPCPNEDALQRQKHWLEESCEIFLEKEEEYCQSTGARPWVLEAAIGLDEEPRSPLDCREPISLGLNNGQLIRLGGRIDRVDRLNANGSECYAIWDYKSGSDWGFELDSPFQQGRKLQSLLYVGMLRHRLTAVGKNKDAAITFGYFFPNSKTQGKRIEWTATALKQGDEILQDLCLMIQRGAFPATTNPDDCKFCDYTNVCQDARLVAIDSIRMTSSDRNKASLGLWKKLRAVESED